MPYLTGNPCLCTRDGSDKRRDEVAVDVGAIDDANDGAVVGNDGGLFQVLVCKNSRDAAEVVVDAHRDDGLRRN